MTESSPPPRLVYDDPRQVDAAALPDGASPAEQLTFMLNWAVRAPSVLNTQPWFFAIDDRLVRLHADRSRQLRVLDPEGRALAISCGAALLFLDVAARHFGYATEAYLQPVAEHPDVLATLLLAHGGVPTDEDEALFEALDARDVSTTTFDSPSLPADVADQLRRGVEAEDVRLHIVSDRTGKEKIADLVAAGVIAQAEDPRFNSEIRSWLRTADDRQRDGVPKRLRSLCDRHAPLQIPPPRVAEHRRGLAMDAPALLVLATDADDTVAWVKAGRALGRLVLTAAAASVPLSYMNQPVEVGALRSRLGAILDDPSPQLVLCIGHSNDRRQARRRAVRDVLLKPQTLEWNWTMV